MSVEREGLSLEREGGFEVFTETHVGVGRPGDNDGNEDLDLDVQLALLGEDVGCSAPHKFEESGGEDEHLEVGTGN